MYFLLVGDAQKHVELFQAFVYPTLTAKWFSSYVSRRLPLLLPLRVLLTRHFYSFDSFILYKKVKSINLDFKIILFFLKLKKKIF